MLTDLLPKASAFWAKVNKGSPEECWPWGGYCRPAQTSSLPYGVWRFAKSKAVRAHRAAWIEHPNDDNRAAWERVVEALAPAPAPRPTLMAGVKEWAPIWAPFLAMLIPTLALVLTSMNFTSQITALGTQIAAVGKTLHDDIADVNTRLDPRPPPRSVRHPIPYRVTPPGRRGRT